MKELTAKLFCLCLLLSGGAQTGELERYPGMGAAPPLVLEDLVDTDGQIRYVAYGQLKWDDPAIKRTIEDMLGEAAGTGGEAGGLLPVTATD